jgi:hypothetical protein
MGFSRIVSEVFLNDVNGLGRGYSTRDARHPVPSRDVEQLLIHREALREAFHPAQTGSVPLDARSIFVPFTVYAGTGFQEVAARSSDIRLLRRAI